MVKEMYLFAKTLYQMRKVTKSARQIQKKMIKLGFNMMPPADPPNMGKLYTLAMKVVEEDFREKLSKEIGFPRDHWVIDYRWREEVKAIELDQMQAELSRPWGERRLGVDGLLVQSMRIRGNVKMAQRIREIFNGKRGAPQPPPGVM